MAITNVEGVSNILTSNIKNQSTNQETNENFSDVLKNAVYKVNESQINADNSIESFIKGDDITMHEVMLSVQESQMSMQLMLEVRNKVVEAYKEVNGVQL